MIDVNERYLKEHLRKEREYEESLSTCEWCGECIGPGEWMFEIDGEIICMDCLKNEFGKKIY